MSDVSCNPKRRSIRRQRSIYQVHYSIKRQDNEMTAKPLQLPTSSLEIQAYSLQVAGHRNTGDTKYLGEIFIFFWASGENLQNVESRP